MTKKMATTVKAKVKTVKSGVEASTPNGNTKALKAITRSKTASKSEHKISAKPPNGVPLAAAPKAPAKPAARPPAKPVAGSKPVASSKARAATAPVKPAASVRAAQPAKSAVTPAAKAVAPPAHQKDKTMVRHMAAKSSEAVKTAAITSPAAPAQKAPAPPSAAEAKKPLSQRHGFRTSEQIVYPAHGVGRIVSIEEQEVAGLKLELFVITFEKDKMTLRVPTAKIQSVGMRKLAEEPTVHKAMETLKGRARIKRTMWSRRAQEYEAKINSGDLISIAEVVRDLYRSESQPEQSYSERQLYEAALDRMAREIAAVEKLDDRGAVQKITEVLTRTARGAKVERGGSPESQEAA